jgi:hypothetical protein
MALDRTTGDKLLKEGYREPARMLLNQGTPLLAQVEKDTESIEGRRLVLAVHVGRSEGVGSLGENDNVPAAQEQRYENLLIPPKYQAGRIRLSLAMMKSASGGKASFLKALEVETKGMLAELKEDVDRQIAFNDSLGRNRLATTGVTTASNTVVIAAEFVTRYTLRKNMRIDIIDNDDDSVLAADRKITSVTKNAAGQVTAIGIDGAVVTTDATHRITRTGSWKDGFVGIPGIVAKTGLLHGIDPATEPEWASAEEENGGTPRALTDDVLQEASDLAWANVGDENAFMVVSNTFQRRKYIAAQTAIKQHVNTMDLKGGYKSISWNDNPFVIDRFVSDDRLYLVNRKHLKLGKLADWDWFDEDGAILSRVADKMAVEAFIYMFGELLTDRRNAHVLVSDLTTS